MNTNEFGIKESKFDVVGFIENAKENLGWVGIDGDFIVLLSSHNNTYYENDIEEKIDFKNIENYLKEDNENAIFIPVAISNLDGGVLLANKKIIQESEINIGSIELYEDTSVGVIVSLIDDQYKIIIAEYNACIGCYDITDDSGELGDEVIEIINSFTV